MAASSQLPQRSKGRAHPRRPRRFRPRPQSWLVIAITCVLLIGLGVWQIRRGLDKAGYLAQVKAAVAAPPRALGSLADGMLPPLPRMIHVSARGHYVQGRQLLMEGRSDGDQLGYDVLTPFMLRSGAIVLVNRGWVPRNARTQRGPAVAIDVPAGEREIDGLWRTLPEPGLRLNAHNCRPQPWPRYVSYPTHADLSCIYGDNGQVKLRRGVIDLAPTADGGFVRTWHTTDRFPAMRHYGYAAQWFMFCIIALYVFYRLSLREVPVGEGDSRGSDEP